MPAPRLASDCPAHVLYPRSQEAIPEHTTAYRAAAIARPARAGGLSCPYISCRGIPRYRDDSLCPYNGFAMTPLSYGAASAVPESPQAGPFLEGLTDQDFAELAWTHTATAWSCAASPRSPSCSGPAGRRG